MMKPYREKNILSRILAPTGSFFICGALASLPVHAASGSMDNHELLVFPGILLLASAAVILLLIRRVRSYRAELKHQDDFYNIILTNANSLSIVWDTHGGYTEMNTYMARLLGSPTKVSPKTVHRIFGDDEKESPPDVLLRNALDKGGRFFSFRTRDGEERHVVFNSVIIRSQGENDYLLSVGSDVTENMHLRNELTEKNYNLALSEERYSIALESADIGIFMIDVGKSNAIYLSDNARKILGFAPHETITGTDFQSRLHPSDYQSFTFDMNQLLIGLSESFAIEARMLISSGDYHVFLFKCRNAFNANREVIRATGAFIDITSQKEIHNLIDKTTFSDELTGLPNRRKFMLEGENILIKAREAEQKAALIYFDVDRFQRINSLAGYDAGDAVLREIAISVARILPTDALFARLGGDDFGILMFYKEREEVDILLAGLSFAVGNIQLGILTKDKITISSGISLFCGDSENVISLYDKANMALTVAKTLPNESYKYFNQSIQQLVLERELLEKDLLEAYAQRQFILYYQPKSNIATQELAGVEALIRWNHPQKGLIPPSVFIPAAEEMGLITRIDEWGMREACRQNKRWQDMGYPPVKVSVNISQAQFYHTDILSSIEAALAETGLDPRWLEIELTETMAMRDIKRTIEIIKNIKARGVSISLDDFGSGYSSLSSLKIVPIDILKIDRSLVIDLENSETSREITGAIVSLAKSMQLVILAEGVETVGQRDILQELGCHLIQGYYYGRPVDPETFVKYFEKAPAESGENDLGRASHA